MPLVVVGERWRRDVVAAAPDLGLPFPIPGGGLGLVETLQRAVVALVQSPAFRDWNPHQVEHVKSDPKRANRALEHRRIRDVKDIATLPQKAAGLARLLPPLLGEVHIGPAGEPVFVVPGALAMPQQ